MAHDPGKQGDAPAKDVPDAPYLWRSRRARALAVVFLVLLGGAALWGARHWRRPGPEPATEERPAENRPSDPRLGYAGPFLNVHPDVSYVGDEKCSECHRDLALSYRRHPMGRSLLPIAQLAASQRYDEKANNPFEALGAQFLVRRAGSRVFHRQIGRDEQGRAVYESDISVDYVLGSGARGHSYLSDRDGYVFQTPVSWFSQKQRWDVSPGFGVTVRSGRPVPALCLFCHANRTRPREDYINRYEQPLFEGHAIGCERCHGPGDRHVKGAGRKDPVTGADYTIVNPRRLEPKLRAAVCEQCHLAGEARVVRRGRDLYDFRPGLPLEDFQSVFVRATSRDEPRNAVNHVEQMYLSRCFLRSEEKPARGKRKLGCTSCHDPHRHVEPPGRVAYYRKRCLECHRTQGCSVPVQTRLLESKEDSCIDCHMPRYPAADIAHTAATDHRIIRRPDKAAPSSAGKSRGNPGIVPFYRRRLDPNDKEGNRDLGIALAHVMILNLAQGKPPPGGGGQQALDLLEGALRNDPEDLRALEVRAEVLSLLGRQQEALAAYEAVLARAPHREASLLGAALVAQDQRQFESALSRWRRAAQENPYQSYYCASLSQMLAERKSWAEALAQAKAWVRLDPANIDARVHLVRCLIKTGQRAQARAEFSRIERLRPPNLPVLQARFTVELRER
jgi:hypothetical protein